MDTRPSNGDVPPKSALFCPNCGHRSRPDGDWRTAETADGTRYLCPDCDAEVTTRSTVRTGRSADPWPPLTESLRLWSRFWSRAVRRW